MDNAVEITCCPLCLAEQQRYKFHDWQGNRFVECEDCALVFQNPRKRVDYEEDYWGESIDPDGKKRILITERKNRIRNLYGDDLKFVNKLKPGRILDAGCGFGFFLSAIDNSWEKFSVELSQYCVDFVKKRYPGIKIVQGDLEECGFENDFFDIVYLFHIIEHVFDPNKITQELNRVLKPNGILIISTPNIRSFCARRFKGNYRLLGTPHVILFSPSNMEYLLKKHGFEVFKKKYPFFKTDYFSFSNLIKLFDKRKISPPFYGNIMTYYARKVV